jgi:alkyl hydroperoxide reductase 1
MLNTCLRYVPYTEESAAITACGIPQNYAASKEWKDKKVVLFAVPGAFTPGCSVRHLPGYIENLEKLRGKKVDIVAVLAFNDAWVMDAWSKANGIKNREEDIVSHYPETTLYSAVLGGC